MGNNNSVKRTAAALGGVCFFFLNVILPLNIWAGIFIDSNLSWKCHVDYISRKVKRSIIGLLSKLRCYVSRDTLINFYYSLIYPFLIYGIIVWGNTYTTSLNSLYILQKKQYVLSNFHVLTNIQVHYSRI